MRGKDVMRGFFLGAMALAGACYEHGTGRSGDGGAVVGPPGDAARSHGGQVDAPALPSAPGALDLVFVIDNSSSMLDEQDALVTAFPAFIRALEQAPGGLPSLRIAIVSSNFGAGPSEPDPQCAPYGDKGRFLVRDGAHAPNAACGLEASGARWLSVDKEGVKNFTGNLANVFACMASLGTTGCGYEHQLQSLRTALVRDIPDNRGFLREDARLGVVILTDEDDCSADPDSVLFETLDPPRQARSLKCSLVGHVCNGQEVPNRDGFAAPLATCQPYERAQDDRSRKSRLINVSEVVKELKALKPGKPDRIVVSAIMGWDGSPDAKYQIGVVHRNKPSRDELDNVPICQSVNGQAAAGVRLKAFVDAFGANGSWHSICQDDLGPTMAEIGRRLADRISR